MAALALATEVNYETTSVARVVGESASDMERQLTGGTLDLTQDVIHAHNSLALRGADWVVRDQFGKAASGSGAASWRFSQMTREFKDTKNYLVLASSDEGNPYSTDAGIVDDVKALPVSQRDLIIFGDSYAGLHMPGTSSFASTFSSRGAYVAPLSYASGLFVKSFVCSVKNARTLGEVFRQARNNYYVNTRSGDEFLGLTLLSYGLYGDPMLPVTVPHWDASRRNSLCADYNEDFDTQEFSSLSADPGVYRRYVTVDFSDVRVVQENNYSVLYSDTVQHQLIPGELVLPATVRVLEFPLKTVITNLSVVRLSDPTDFTVADIPSWDGFAFQKRVCAFNSSDAQVNFDHAYIEDKELVFVRIMPAEVVDCARGHIRIYRRVEFVVTYLPYSPVLIKELDVVERVLPGQRVDVAAVLEHTQRRAIGGEFVLSGEGGTLSVVPVSTTQSTVQLDFIAPEKEGRYHYRLDFLEGNISKTYTTFDVEVSMFEASLRAKEVVGNTAEVIITLKNNLNRSVNISMLHALSRDGSPVASGQSYHVIAPGIVDVPLSYDIQRSNGSYDALVTFPSLSKVLSGTVFANRAPVITQGDIIVSEGETLRVEPIVVDANSDSLRVTTRLPIEGQLSFESSGNYTIDIKASDGIEDVSKSVRLEVANKNRAPVIQRLASVRVTAGELVHVVVNVSDPDNENNISNDDNALAIRYGAPLNASGEWQTSMSATGDFTVTVSVLDGELSAQEKVLVAVARVACEKNSECGTDGVDGEGVCRDDVIYKSFRTHFCRNPGTINASCDSVVNVTRFQECAPHEICTNSTQGALCKKVTCAVDGDCPSGNDGEPFCSDNAVLHSYRQGICVGKGTRSAYCDARVSNVTITRCSDTQACVNARCTSIICTSDAGCGAVQEGASSCLDTTRVWQSTTSFCRERGTSCVRETLEQKEECAVGCSLGACVGRVSCMDSDGRNNTVRGNVTVTNQTPTGNVSVRVLEDFCADDDTLVEHTCSNRTASPEQVICDAGCSGGACAPWLDNHVIGSALVAGVSQALAVPQSVREVGLEVLTVTSAANQSREQVWVEVYRDESVSVPRTHQLVKAIGLRTPIALRTATLTFTLQPSELGSLQPRDIHVWHVHNTSWPGTFLTTSYSTVSVGNTPLHRYTVTVPGFSSFVLAAVVDADGDGVVDSADNCPSVSNPGQGNADGDSFGDVCDSDVDGDGIQNSADSCMWNRNTGGDSDTDGIDDVCDSRHCPLIDVSRVIPSRWAPFRDMPSDLNVNCIGGNSADGNYGAGSLCGIVLLDFKCPSRGQLEGNVLAACERNREPTILSQPTFTWPVSGHMYCGYSRDNYLNDPVGAPYNVRIKTRCCMS